MYNIFYSRTNNLYNIDIFGFRQLVFHLNMDIIKNEIYIIKLIILIINLMESYHLINIYNINDIKKGDYVIITRTFMTQKYLDSMDDDELNEFYKQEGNVTDIDIINDCISIINIKNNNITIYFSTKSVNTFVQKRVPIIIIE